MASSLVELSPSRVPPLIEAARSGSNRSFLTKSGNTRYGAAVLTASGKLFCAGQYSSFNHITNIHAEMAAVVLATMADDPEIVALALVSTSPGTDPPTPCGICRQFLHEHSQRTGREILIIMATWDGSVVRSMPLSELLPEVWVPRSRLQGHVAPRWGILPPWRPGQTSLQFGDLVQTDDRFLSVVWAGEWQPGIALLKMKYDATAANDPLDPTGKLPHSFTHYSEYLKALRDKLDTSTMPWGEPAYLVPHEKIQGRLPRLPLRSTDLARQTIDPEGLQPVLGLLDQAGISIDQAYLTCSWIVGMAKPESDFDIAIEADSDQIRALRKVIHQAFSAGKLTPPYGSSTWTRLADTGKTPEALVQEGRFLETFGVKSQDCHTSCSLIYLRPGPEPIYFPVAPESEGVARWQGIVIDDAETSYKPGKYVVKTEDGRELSVQSWHKWSGLIKEGDRVVIEAAECVAERSVLVQMNPDKHTIRWIRW